MSDLEQVIAEIESLISWLVNELFDEYPEWIDDSLGVLQDFTE